MKIIFVTMVVAGWFIQKNKIEWTDDGGEE